MSGGIRTAYRAIPGGRSYQEDYCQFSLAGGADSSGNGSGDELLAVLADGMGGQGASGSGATASETACRSFVKSYCNGDGSIAERLDVALGKSNDMLAKKKAEEPALGDMGTTLIGATVHNNALQWISVGDSHLYLFRDGRLEKLNEDHSFVPMLDKLVERGELSPEDALSHPNRHAIRSAVMGAEIELKDLRETSLPLRKDDVIILASDGLDTLEHDTIAGLISESAAGGPEAIAEDLLEAVDTAGKPDQDNTTVMVITVTEGTGPAGIPGSFGLPVIVALVLLGLAAAGATAWVMDWRFPLGSSETGAPVKSDDGRVDPAALKQSGSSGDKTPAKIKALTGPGTDNPAANAAPPDASAGSDARQGGQPGGNAGGQSERQRGSP